MTDPALVHWATTYRIEPAALLALSQLWPTDPNTTQATGEHGVSNAKRLEVSRRGGRLWRNNKGAYVDSYGNHIRYGLCNESKKLGAKIRSSDLIGIQPVLITPEMVGTTIGRFEAYEAKKPGWRYKGTEHEKAQLNFLQLVNSLGGKGEFIC